jgi:TolB-like protein
MTADVCVSYSSKDRARVTQLVDHLRRSGVSVWIDQGGIDGATLWGEEIVEAIEGSKALILALSANSAESQNVVKEVSLALERKKSILPVNLEPVEVPKALRYPLAGIQHVSYHADATAEDLQNVLRALSRVGVMPEEKKPPAPATPEAARVLDAKVIAVLPFINMSPDQESDYFSDGLTEELIANLSRLKGMTVVSRMITMQYKGVKLNIQSIRRELGARYIVEGTVRRFRDDLRITADLMDLENATQLWAESFKGTMADVFDIQESVSAQIVEALMLKLTPNEKVVLSKRPTTNAEAFDLYLRARDYLYRLTKTNVHFAIQLFEKAIALDQRYAAAYAGLGEAYATMFQLFERKQEWLDHAIEFGLKGLMYDSTLSEAYSALAQAYYNKSNLEEAQEAAEKAVELSADNFIGYYILGRIHVTMDDYPAAADAFSHTITINPDFYSGYYHLSMAYERMGDTERAQQVSKRQLDFFPGYLARHPDDARAHMFFATVLAASGAREEAKFEGSTALELSPGDALMQYNAACLYARLSEPALAVAALRQALESGHAEFEWIKRDPDLDSIREDPGYVELMKNR